MYDRRIAELQHTISQTFSSTLFTHLFPHSTISISLHVLSQDGALLAACINATTLALIDAGIPMADYVTACTTGLGADPLLDLNAQEELELPFLTVGTVGAGKTDGGGEKVSVLVMETRVEVGRLESMLAVGVDGCKQVKEVLDRVVRKYGKRALQGGAAT